MTLDADAMRQHLWAHLEEAEYLATQFERWTDADVEQARALIPDLVGVIRGLVAEHDDHDASTCRTCHMPWPCPTLSSAVRLVQDPSNELTRILNAAYTAGERS